MFEDWIFWLMVLPWFNETDPEFNTANHDTLLWWPYLCVEEWARVEELWDLEEWWLPVNDAPVPPLITLSVAGTFFEIYYERHTMSVNTNHTLKCSRNIRIHGWCSVFVKDLHPPWGSPPGRGPGDWAHWPGCDWGDPDTCSASGDCASSSSVS